MPFLKLILPFVLLSALLGCTQNSGVRAPYDVTIPAEYQLGTGDEVEITVYGEDELSGLYNVSAQGQIAFPLIGNVDVEGLSVPVTEQRLAELLKDGYLKDPSVSLEVLAYRPFFILGEVREPGSYAYVSDMSVLNAAALAGGFTYRANKKMVDIRRKVQSGELIYEDLPIQTKVLPGDIITINERFL